MFGLVVFGLLIPAGLVMHFLGWIDLAGPREGMGEVLVVSDYGLGKRDEVFYMKEVSAAEARQLAELLQDLGYFGNNKNGATVQVYAQGEGLVVAFCLVKREWDRPGVIQTFRELREELTRLGVRRPAGDAPPVRRGGSRGRAGPASTP